MDELVFRFKSAEQFEYKMGQTPSEYIKNIIDCSLDEVPFEEEDFDWHTILLRQEYEVFKLFDGRWFGVCWRYCTCHIWEESVGDL